MVTAKDSKLLSTILINVLYPCLLFPNVIVGVKPSNIGSFGIMTVASAAIVVLGLLLGTIVLKLTNPPPGFRYGSVMATAMGNHGDMVLAVCISVGNLPPFSAGDSAKGVAYVGAFICFTNIFFFTIGYKYIGEDFKNLPKADQSSLTVVETVTATRKESHLESIETRIETSEAVQPSNILIIEEDTKSKPTIYSTAKEWAIIFFNPSTIATILGLIVTMVPVLRNLFYTDDTLTATATSQPLAFIFKSFQLVGGGAVPIGILNVGTALGRLQLKKFAPIRVIGAIGFCRLILMPVLGIVLVQVLATHGIIDANDKMMRFVIMLEAAVPTASTCVFLTQFWHPKGESDMIASVVVVQYGIAMVSMTFALAVMLSLLS
ncbi:Protein M3 [Rhizoclosmatium sp. JEL0117]|nr:Protein M3 [Rhizoclosmatium sp. JEL0117]